MTRPHGSTVAGKLKIIPTERSPRLFWLAAAAAMAIYLWVEDELTSVVVVSPGTNGFSYRNWFA